MERQAGRGAATVLGSDLQGADEDSMLYPLAAHVEALGSG